MIGRLETDVSLAIAIIIGRDMCGLRAATFGNAYITASITVGTVVDDPVTKDCFDGKVIYPITIIVGWTGRAFRVDFEEHSFAGINLWNEKIGVAPKVNTLQRGKSRIQVRYIIIDGWRYVDFVVVVPV